MVMVIAEEVKEEMFLVNVILERSVRLNSRSVV